MTDRFERCDKCIWWHSDHKDTLYGECRVNPPIAPRFIQQTDDHAMENPVDEHKARIFPLTFCDDFCGKFVLIPMKMAEDK